MVVYLEDAIFDTTIINFVILYLSLYSLRQKIKIYKVILSALFGCLLSIGLTFFTLPQWLNISSKLLCGGVMATIVLPNFSFRLLSVFFLVFLSFTCLIGGFCFFIIYLLGGEVYSLTSMSYNLPISLGFITILIWLYVFFLIKIIQIFYKKQKLESFYYDIKLCANYKTIKIKAYLDSGNLLQDPKTGLPVLILNLKTFLKLFEDKINAIDCINGKLPIKIGGKYIDFYSVGKMEKLYVFEPQMVQLATKNNIQQKKLNVLIGVSINNFNNQNFDALLSPLCV